MKFSFLVEKEKKNRTIKHDFYVVWSVWQLLTDVSSYEYIIDF